MVQLSGAIPDQSNGFGTRDFDFRRIQNGPSDGIALVNGDGTVVEFLSYEGSFTATEGLATGTASTNSPEVESNETPVGHSLQKTEQGSLGSDFTWAAAQQATPGSVNTLQVIQ